MYYRVKQGSWLERRVQATQVEERQLRRLGMNVKRLLGLGLIEEPDRGAKAKDMKKGVGAKTVIGESEQA